MNASPQYQTGIILGGGFFPDGTLTTLSLQRLNAGIELYKRGEVETLTVLGGVKSTYFQDAIQYDIPGAQKRADYLNQHGVPANKIHQITDGKDTIGEALACKAALPGFGTTRFILVTSKLHMPRAEWLFKTILGPKYDIGCLNVSCEGWLLEEEEKEYLAATQNYLSAHEGCLNDTSEWHEKHKSLYENFKEIHDKFHPKGKESQAYAARNPGLS